MKPSICVAILFAAMSLAACNENKAPAPKTGGAVDTHPVKNLDALPAGSIREGGRTMNKASDMGGTLEQQKQSRDKEVESQAK